MHNQRVTGLSLTLFESRQGFAFALIGLIIFDSMVGVTNDLHMHQSGYRINSLPVSPLV